MQNDVADSFGLNGKGASMGVRERRKRGERPRKGETVAADSG